MSNYLFGMWIGGCLGILFCLAFFQPNRSLEKFSLDHGIAHYDSKTAKYTQDSLIMVDDSTIRIKRQ